MAQQYDFPGDYSFKKIDVISKDGNRREILEFMNSLVVIEDMHNPFLTATMAIEDGVGLMADLPIVGEEQIELKFNVDGSENIEWNFFVYRVGDYKQISQSASEYTLYMISQEALADANTKFSKSYKQETVDSIAKDAFSFLDSDKSFNVDSVEGNQHIIVPYWSPVKTINQMTRYAVHPSYTENMFMFFENQEGFQFQNLPTLFEQEPVDEIIPKNVSNEEETENREKWEGKNITEFEIVNTPDKLTGLRDGRYASKVLTVDNVTKNLQTDDAVAKDEDLTLMNGRQTFSDQWSYNDPNQRFHVMATKQHRSESSYYTSNANSDLSAVDYQETIKWNSMILSQLSSTTVEATMYGLPQIKAGKILRTKLPKASALIQHSTQKKDRYRSADYLITRCEHSFMGRYNIKVTLQTNSYPKPLENNVEE